MVKHISRLLLIMEITWLLSGCTADNWMESQPPVVMGKDSVQQNSSGVAIQDLLLELKADAEKGMMHGIELALGASFEQVKARYGEPQEIRNSECRTYSHGHSETNAYFFFAHDSCTNLEELNELKPDSILNQISVSSEQFHVEITEQEVRHVLGKPDKEYWRESYGGYHLLYELDRFQLLFVVNEHSTSREIYEIFVLENIAS